MFKKVISIIALTAIIYSKANAVVLSPQITCISVLANGNITLTWTTPTDPSGQFVSYQIYSSNALGGPYILVPGGTINVYGQTTYTVPCACGNIATVYFYIITNYTGGASLALDTVQSIFLTATPGFGIANLNWNAPITPPLASSLGIYNIFMEYPVGTWTQIGSTTNTNYIDTIFPCNATISFRVEIGDNEGAGCTSVSSVATGIFQNQITPPIPTLDTLSVNVNNNSMLNWNTNSAPDFEGYVIYRWDGAGWIPVDTVFGVNNTNYTYVGGVTSPNNGSESYQVAAFDSCGKISPMSPPLMTMYLTVAADICAHSAILSWTASPIIGNGLAGYNIYQSSVSQAGPYTLIGNVSSGTLTFVASGLTTGTTYYYNIEAYDFSGTQTASSNRRQFSCPSPQPPKFIYLASVSVSAPNRVDLTALVDTSASVLGYKIMRSTDSVPASSYTQVGFVGVSLYPLIQFSDLNASTETTSYYYKVINVDSCGFNGLSSNWGRTMLVTAQGNGDFTNTVTWNDYSQWADTVASYNIYRGLNGVLDPLPIKNVLFSYSNNGMNTYVDDVSTIFAGDGNFYYEVEAMESGVDTLGFAAVSLSNIAVAKQQDQVFIPNAFAPDGLNNKFTPVVIWAAYADYEFDIFDRFGQQIFTTTDIGKGWDGTAKGKLCDLGVYIYKLHLKSAKGVTTDRNGIVTLIR